jgi:hypothetical protein
VIDGHYKDGAYFSSFAGFVPSEKPALTALVVLDEPTPIFGGLVAAPVFAQLARYGLRELQVPPPPASPAMFDGVPHAGAGATVVVGEPGGDVAGVPGQAAPPIMPVSTSPTTTPTSSLTTTALPVATTPAAKLGGPTTTAPPGKATSPVVSTPPPAGNVIAPSQTSPPTTAAPAGGPGAPPTTVRTPPTTATPTPPPGTATPTPPAGGVPTTLSTARSQPPGPSP